MLKDAKEYYRKYRAMHADRIAEDHKRWRSRNRKTIQINNLNYRNRNKVLVASDYGNIMIPIEELKKIITNDTQNM